MFFQPSHPGFRPWSRRDRRTCGFSGPLFGLSFRRPGPGAHAPLPKPAARSRSRRAARLTPRGAVAKRREPDPREPRGGAQTVMLPKTHGPKPTGRGDDFRLARRAGRAVMATAWASLAALELAKRFRVQLLGSSGGTGWTPMTSGSYSTALCRSKRSPKSAPAKTVKNTPLRRPPPRPSAHRARPKPGTPPPAPIYTTPVDVTCQRRWRRGDWFAGVGDNADRENALIRSDTGRPAQGRRRAESETAEPCVAELMIAHQFGIYFW